MSLAELTERFRALGAPDPESWARSQLEEGIPQLVRFLFLREAWRRVIAEDDPSWIEREIAQAEREPDAPFAGVGRALHRLRMLGASDTDLTDLARGTQAELLFVLCELIDDAFVDDPAADGISWTLVEVGEDGEVLGAVGGLHESVLETDPTGREMRPRPTP